MNRKEDNLKRKENDNENGKRVKII